MRYAFKSELLSNAEGQINPSTAEVVISEKLYLQLPLLIKTTEDLEVAYLVKWWAGAYEFFDKEGKPFDPDYRVDGCTLKVYQDGTFQFVFELNHSTEECWTQDFKIEDGVLVVEEQAEAAD